MYKMKDEFRTGIKVIDEEHAVLFSIADKIYKLLNDKFAIDKYDKIVELIDELREYTEFHFKDEEEYMESINYTRMFTQKIDHNNFIKKLDEVKLQDIDENQDKYILEMLEFVNDWLINHIMQKDKLIGK